jgi:hypothetical protein
MWLYMILLGSKPPGRRTEQHDFFFGFADNLANLGPQIVDAWPEAGKTLHLDGWRKVTSVGEYTVEVVPNDDSKSVQAERLFFINLGGYRPGELVEFHYQVLCVAPDKADAIQQSKQTAFFKHTGFKGADSHIDDKYGIDVDDVFAIEDILPDQSKKNFRIRLTKANSPEPDTIQLGYFKMDKLLSIRED